MQDCFSQRKCFRCKGKHHTSICEREESRVKEKKKWGEGKEKEKEDDTTRSNAALTPKMAYCYKLHSWLYTTNV